ncbi:MAG: hypothetical protein IJV65_03465 [Kiritimatiellae bacterium]|nr:hypothetical protein [Kiritimatiellia bacterium]
MTESGNAGRLVRASASRGGGRNQNGNHGLGLAAGVEARFPKRKIRFDDGIVSGSTELPSRDAFVAVGIRF